MERPGKPKRRAMRLIFVLCGMAQSALAQLVPYAKARVHANDYHERSAIWPAAAVVLWGLNPPHANHGALASRYGCKRLIQTAAGAIFLGVSGCFWLFRWRLCQRLSRYRSFWNDGFILKVSL